jgi:hypothetical protein
MPSPPFKEKKGEAVIEGMDSGGSRYVPNLSQRFEGTLEPAVAFPRNGKQ